MVAVPWSDWALRTNAASSAPKILTCEGDWFPKNTIWWQQKWNWKPTFRQFPWEIILSRGNVKFLVLLWRIPSFDEKWDYSDCVLLNGSERFGFWLIRFRFWLHQSYQWRKSERRCLDEVILLYAPFAYCIISEGGVTEVQESCCRGGAGLSDM